MSCDAVRDNLAAMAIGALDEAEEREVREHLATCPRCRRELEAYASITRVLNEAVPPAQLPSGFTERLLERASPLRVLPTPRRPLGSRLPWLLAAACMVLALGLGGWGWMLHAQVDALEARVAWNRDYYAGMAQLMADPRVHSLPLEASSGAIGSLYLTPERRAACLVLSGLRDPGRGRAYQVWLNTPGRKVSGGVFTPLPNGTAWVYLDPKGGIGQYRSIGVTVEPAGGSVAPTSLRVIGRDL